MRNSIDDIEDDWKKRDEDGVDLKQESRIKKQKFEYNEAIEFHDIVICRKN